MKKVCRIVGLVLLSLLILAAGYVAYVLIAYHRLGNQSLGAEGAASAGRVPEGEILTVLSYNIGFGAYEADYSFFMDGGTESWARSKEQLDANLKQIAALIAARNADFCLIQEVDSDATRSYHLDERRYLTDVLTGYGYTFAQNYDSPFLCYPFYQPHGASRSGLLTASRFELTAAERIELPVETGFSKFLDLDRCYAKSRFATAGGGELVLYHFHLSAYTSDGTVATEQLKLLLEDMKEEYRQGRYAIAGGDFNKDVLGDSSVYFGSSDAAYTWAQPIPEGLLDAYPVVLVAPLDRDDPVPSCRNADAAYHPGQYVLTVDGFLVTENVTVVDASVIDTGFAYSDHNPVVMRFLAGVGSGG